MQRPHHSVFRRFLSLYVRYNFLLFETLIYTDLFKFNGTAEFSSEIAKSLNFTAEHTENAKAPENLSND